jgi:hypothetical protein
VPIIEIKVDPSMPPAIPVNQNVIPSYVAVPLPMLMQKADSLCAFNEMIQDIRELLIKIGLMVYPHITNICRQGLPSDEVQNANEVALFVRDRIPLHEIVVAGYQFEDARLLLWASKALKLDVSDTRHEFFIKHKFQDLQAAVFQINGSFDPEFDLILKSEALFLGVMANKIKRPVQGNHVVIFNPEKVGGVRMNPESSGYLMGWKPDGNHLFQSFL